MNKATIRMTAAVAVFAAGFGTASSALAADGYWGHAAGGDGIWKNTPGECWRTGYWTPAMAIAACDPGLVKKAAPPMRAPAPRSAPAKPAMTKPAMKPKVLNVTSTELFTFNKSVLSDAGKAKLDSEVLAKLGGFSKIQLLSVSGHTDRLGSAQYNQKLSEKRAEVVKAYLVSKGVSASSIETFGYGKTNPVKACPDQKDRKALIACLAPNRRVVVHVKGLPK
ncbi:MAG: OmpA family protein [Proteobacteria bacterium]|nr:OmpA family protein [Pseudomonadota bacterium]